MPSRYGSRPPACDDARVDLRPAPVRPAGEPASPARASPHPPQGGPDLDRTPGPGRAARRVLDSGHAAPTRPPPGSAVTGALGAGLAAGYAIAIPVGAIALYLIMLSSRAGFAVGAAAGLGVATVDGAYATLAVLGGSVVGPFVASIHEPLRWASVAVLVGLGVRMAWPAVRPVPAPSPAVAGRHHPRWGNPGDAVDDAGAVAAVEQAAGSHPSPARAYVTLVGLTAVNPATVVYFAALVTAGGLGAAAATSERVAFVVGALVASASWQLVVATGGSLLGRALASPTAQRVTAAVGGGVVVLLAVRLGLGG